MAGGTHGRGGVVGGMHSRGHAWQGTMCNRGVCGRGHAWQQAVCSEVVHGGEACVAGGCMAGVDARGCVVEMVRILLVFEIFLVFLEATAKTLSIKFKSFFFLAYSKAHVFRAQRIYCYI